MEQLAALPAGPAHTGSVSRPQSEVEAVHAASALGHRVGIVQPHYDGGRWGWGCTCGKLTAKRQNGVEALDAAVHHARKVVAQSRTNGGVSVRSSVGGVL